MLPPLAKDVLSQGAFGLAALQVAIGIGALIGAVISVPVASRFGDKRLTITAGFLFAGLVLVLALSQVFLLSLFVAALTAGVATVYFVTNMITMQLTSSPEFRSRVISVRFIMFGFGPFGMIVLGLIAEFMGTQWSLGISAVSGGVVLLLIALFLKTDHRAATEGSESLLGTAQVEQVAVTDTPTPAESAEPYREFPGTAATAQVSNQGGQEPAA